MPDPTLLSGSKCYLKQVEMDRIKSALRGCKPGLPDLTPLTYSGIIQAQTNEYKAGRMLGRVLERGRLVLFLGAAFLFSQYMTGLKELSFWPGSGQNRENDERDDREPKISGFESQTTREDRDFRLLSRPTRAHVAKCDAS